MKEMKTKYEPNVVEEGKYDFWLKGGYFRSGDKTKEPFTIVIPPPNVTGKLHIGHACDTTIQDVIIRRKRMQGYDALYLPGTDHAGVATQAKIDERLRKDGINRHEIGREAFLKVAWKWTEDYKKIIREQWATIGLSVDYSKERFTLDEGLNHAVNKVFIDLYKQGIIYQGDRIINWDPEAKTALSNIEVEHKEVNGNLYYFVYPFVEGEGGIVVATTRPETMFADQAVMVHPEDERYQDFIGKKVWIPSTDIQIPIIADEYVDREFGTGCVKVTPAHDPNDFEVGLRHHLSMPHCMDEESKMLAIAGKYVGLDRFVCRKQLVEDLKEFGLLVKIEPLIHMVGHSERTGVIVEPRLSKQWFVKMEPLAKQALEKSTAQFVPERFYNNFARWMENINDWCISRQVWWGHQIPAWYRGEEVLVQVECPGAGWKQDEDVLDTWFSSALWPFSTLGWPEDTEDFKRYFPTDVMVMGYDILPFWCSRMIFQSLQFTGQTPFKHIIMHGLIRDNQGRKMSKSLGNGVDPLDVAKRYGTDAMRYFLTTNAALGTDLRYDEEKITSAWNYINKLWNISRFVLMNLDLEQVDMKHSFPEEELSTPSKWILHRMNQVIEEVDRHYDNYDFSEAAKSIYNFVWDDFASWYVELSKIDLQEDSIYRVSTMNVLHRVLLVALKLLHPFIPFVTEEIYQILPHEEESIMISAWPTKDETCQFGADYDLMNICCQAITAIRNIRAERNHPLSKPITLYLETKLPLAKLTDYIMKFVNTSSIIMKPDVSHEIRIDQTISKILPDLNIFIPSAELIDREKELARLKEELKKIEGELQRSEKMLSNENFLSKAKPEKIEEEKRKFETYQTQYQELQDILKDYE